METGQVEVPIIVRTYQGDEAVCVLAQARGYRRMAAAILTGVADRDAAEFVSKCKRISFEAANEGA